MTVRAITLREPQIARVTFGLLTALRRPSGKLSDFWRAGDLLWIREPFHLPRELDHRAPSTAIAFGAQPVFVTDFRAAAPPQGLGRRRFGRELPRAAHRQHLRLTALEHQPLQDITDAEVEAEGYASRDGFAEAWDANLSLARSPGRWVNNPDVLVLRFERIAGPIPELAA